MSRRQTISEQRWPNTGDFVKLANALQTKAVITLLNLVWKAYDLLLTEVLSQVDSTQSDADLERQITQLLEPRIHRVMDGAEPFFVQHNSYELESRKAAPAQPPEYDIAFVLHQNERIKWPVEAKVLRTQQNTTEYVRSVTQQFLTCRYAPFSSQAAMLGYLLSGSPQIFLSNAANQIGCAIDPNPDFPNRDHGVSNHIRVIPTGKAYPVEFKCHHLILPIP